MKFFKVVTVALLAVASSFSAQGAVGSRVVLSNMGPDGLTNTSGGFSDTLSGTNPRASGFMTGSVAQRLDSISLIAASPDSSTVSKSVRLYQDNGGSPGAFIASSTATSLSSTKSAYTFLFGSTTLSANTAYWVLPDAGLAWYTTDPATNPAQQNGSGFSYSGDKISSDSGSNWNSNFRRRTISIFTTDDGVTPPEPPAAIPEPALTSLLCFGGIALIRRRMKK